MEIARFGEGSEIEALDDMDRRAKRGNGLGIIAFAGRSEIEAPEGGG